MSGLRERLATAVGRELRRHAGDVAPIGISAAIVAGLEVLAEEFSPRPENAAPPVRELPTEPGAVILATAVRGEQTAPILMLRAERRSGTPWCMIHAGLPGLDWYADSDITDWVEATFVPTAVHEAAVKALRDVVELLNGPQSGDAQEAQDAAINALALIDGEAAK